MVGKGKGGDAEIEEFHFTPVSMKDMPTLEKLLKEFFDLVGNESVGNEKAMLKAAQIIELSMKKMHPDMNSEKIIDIFSLGGVAKILSIVMDVNDFLAGMGKIKEMSNQIQLTK